MIKILQKALFLCCFFTLVHSVRGFSQGLDGKENHQTGNAIQVDGTPLLSEDEKFETPEWNTIEKDNSVNNIISLQIIDTDKSNPIPDGFLCTMGLEVTYFSFPNPTVKHAENISLHVDYSKTAGVHYQISDSHKFINGYRVLVTVKSISINGVSVANSPAFLKLSNQIVIDRTYKFVPDLTIRPTAEFMPSKKSVPIASDKQLRLTWPSIYNSIPGAEEYDLEWTTIDEGSTAPVNEEKLFKNNATRITNSEGGYLISLIYTANYLAVRIRQVHYTDGIRLEGPWDYQQKGDSQAVWDISALWHEPNLNWQYSASFAEEAKKKEVINYFDGTLRGRQTATINNSDNVAVVQENVYDEFGRPGASILPTPIKESITDAASLHYFKNFNLNGSNKFYSFRDIANGCEISSGALSSLSTGASHYYSPGNQFKDEKNYNKYIPDAKGYPLSLSQYTPDNTGRIKIQGGVGPTFQPGGSASKTTKYFYGKPEQWELDRLFGNDVGFANHYLKNMVIDPNGQVSISYLNASGKTIATALTGNAPLSQDALSTTNAPKKETTILLRPEQFKFDATDLKLSASTTYLSSELGKATIKYDIEKLLACYTEGAFEICSNCYYDLVIKVKDDCGTEIYPKPNDAGSKEPFKIGSETYNASAVGTHSGSLEDLAFDKIGEYYISFELSLSRKAIQGYTDKFITDGQVNGAIRKELNFIMDYLDKLDLSGFGDCRSCSLLLGEKADFNTLFINKLSDLKVLDSLTVADKGILKDWIDAKYESLKAECAQISTPANCPPVSPCQRYALLMEEDVRPGGQYALFDKNGEILEPALNVLSNNWRTVFPPDNAGNSIPEADLITIGEDGSQTSPYAEGFSLPDLVKYWKEEWAARFLEYHPEHCKLKACREESSVASLNWDKEVQEVDEALSTATKVRGATGGAYNYQVANRALWLLKADPFFKSTGPGGTYHDDMQQDLEQYTSRVLKVTALSTKSLPELLDYITYCAQPGWTTNSQNSTAWESCSPVADCRLPNREWLDYRDKYFELKEIYYKRYRDAYCGNGGVCPVGTPITIPLPGILANNDFNIAEYISSQTPPQIVCVTNEQLIRVFCRNGKVGKPVNVQVYYPGQAALVNVEFTATESEHVICVPASLEIDLVKVINIIQ